MTLHRQNAHQEPDLLTVEQTAQKMNIGRTTVYGLLRDGELPRVRIGHLVRIPASAVREWIDRQTEETKRPSAA
jgi:excisionase family DNA binding protein